MQVLRDVKHFVKDYQGDKLHPLAAPGAICHRQDSFLSMLQQKCQSIGCRLKRLGVVVFYALNCCVSCRHHIGLSTGRGTAYGEDADHRTGKCSHSFHFGGKEACRGAHVPRMHIQTGAPVSQAALLSNVYTLTRIQIVPESICPSKAVLEDCTALLTGSCAEYKTCWIAPTLDIVSGVFLSRGTVAYIMKRATRIHVGFEQQSAPLLGCVSWKGLIYQT